MPISSLVAFAILGQSPIQTTCLSADAILQPLGGALQTAMLSQVKKTKQRKADANSSNQLILHNANGKHIKEGLIAVSKKSQRKAGGGDISDLTITKTTDVSTPSVKKKHRTVISNSGNGVGNTKNQ